MTTQLKVVLLSCLLLLTLMEQTIPTEAVTLEGLEAKVQRLEETVKQLEEHEMKLQSLEKLEQCRLPIFCDFDNGLCSGWQQSVSDVSNWTLHQGATPSFNTGPANDHTTGSGKYMYVEASTPRITGDNAKLEHCVSRRGHSACLKFYYHMYGSTMGTLAVFSGNEEVFRESGDHGNEWLEAKITISLNETVTFEAIRGPLFSSDIAIDDISIIRGSCPALADCGNPGVPENGSKTGENYQAWGLVTYSCDAGYQLEGSTNLVCLENGVWNNPLPKCNRICDEPSPPNNGYIVGSEFWEGKTVTYICNEGYELQGPRSRVCNETGEWTEQEPTCEEIMPCKAVGVEDPSKIPNDQMTAPSYYSYFSTIYYPYKARLNGDSAWCQETDVITDEYLQVDMGAIHTVCGVATQGKRTGSYVKSYKLSFSTDGVEWNTYQEANTDMVFQGNYDLVSIMRHGLIAQQARYVRFYPVTTFDYPCMRVEIFIM